MSNISQTSPVQAAGIAVHKPIRSEDFESERKKRNGRRFMWHEEVIADPELNATALRLAGLVMHDRGLPDKGYSEISAREAARKLNVSRRSVITARNLLVLRKWFDRLNGTGRATGRYGLGNGPGVVKPASPGVVKPGTPQV